MKIKIRNFQYYIRSYRVCAYIFIFRYQQKKRKALRLGLFTVRHVPATVHNPAHSGLFGMEMLGRKMPLCPYNAEAKTAPLVFMTGIVYLVAATAEHVVVVTLWMILLVRH